MTSGVGDDGGAGSAGPLAGVAVFTTFRGRREQLAQWCSHHLAAGAEHLYVVLDRPPADLAAALPDHPRVSWEVVDQDRWDALLAPEEQHVERKQVDAFRWTARRARSEGRRFLAFVDVDELLHLRVPFADLAAADPDTTAFVVPVREMWFDPGTRPDRPFAASLALAPSEPGTPGRAQAFGWREQFLHHGVLGHSAGKSVYRLDQPLGEVTVHRPRSGTRLAARTTELSADAASVLHFDCGDLASWNAKWASRLSQQTVARGLWPHRLAQQDLFAHELRGSAGEQERFFREFFSLSGSAQELLTAAGLLEVVDVGDSVGSDLAGVLDGAVDDPRPPAAEDLARLPVTTRVVDHQFALVCDRRFVRPTLATMLSVLVQVGANGSTRFVVLGDGLDREDVALLRTVEHTAFDVEVLVGDVTADLDRDVGTEDAKRATFGRMYLVDHLPAQRTVYLDGDVLATRDISALFSLDLGEACLGGVPDSAALRLVADETGVPLAQRNRLMGVTGGDPLDYLNGGVLLLALEHPDFRRLALEARALVVRQGRALTQRDQDALNLAFRGRKHRLPSTLNYMTQFYVSERVVDEDLARRKYDAADADLVHFSGRVKPWEAPDDEFYNGLYRRLVSRAEALTGVSCGLYFSTPAPRRQAWSAPRWREALAAPQDVPSAAAGGAGAVEVVAVHDRGILLRTSTALHRLVSEGGHEVLGLRGDEVLLRAPAADLGPVRADLLRRVGPGVRELRVDVAAALRERGGVVRDLDLVLAPAGPAGGSVRVLATLEVLAAGDGAEPDLLSEVGLDGEVEALRGGWVSGWTRADGGAREPVQLLLDGEPVAVRVPEPRGSAEERRAGTRRFAFHLAHLRRTGLGPRGEVSVRTALGNVPLRGGSLTVVDPARDLERDADGTWRPVPEVAAPVAARVRGRLARVAGRVRGGAG